MAELTVPNPNRRPRLRAAVISMHTSPTATLGRKANGGLNVYVRETGAAFAERGIATDVYTRAVDGLAEGCGVEELGPLSRVIYLPAPVAESKYGMLRHAAGFADDIQRFAAAEGTRYDVIHSHYWLSGVAAERLRTQNGAPWVHTAHTLGLVKNRQLADGACPEPPERIVAEREIAAGADRMIASTDSEADDWVWTYGARPERVRVVAPGVDLDSFHPRPRAEARARLRRPAGERIVLFVGRLERLKGVEVLLRAFAMAARGATPARLLVVGEDSRDAEESEEDRLRELVDVLDLGSRVEFLGSVPHSELPDYYAAADVCVMPSYSESFGLVALEAQACGCAVIAASVAGLQSVVRDEVTGYLVAGHEPAAYARRLQALLEEPELAEQMGRRGTLLAQRFTWSRTADRLLEVYDEVLEPAQAGVHLGSRHE